MALFPSFRSPKTSDPLKPKIGMLANTNFSVPENGQLSEKTISVIIPLYNHARYIQATLESVLSQTSPADELILIDDGSSDNGFSIAQNILQNTPNTTLLRQENAGAHNTINRAISLSQGDYIAVLNSDDMFMPGKIKRCRRIIAEIPDIDLIAGDVRFIENDSNTPTKMRKWIKEAYIFLCETGLPQLSLLNGNFVVSTSNMVFSRSLWELSGGFQPLRYCHDLDFLMFAYKNNKVFLDFGHDHIIYRQHASNTIKENEQKVDIEVAAVIAYTLKVSSSALFSEELNTNDLKSFQRMLAHRKMSDLVLFFMAIGEKFKTRSELYVYATDPNRLHMLRNVLG